MSTLPASEIQAPVEPVPQAPAEKATIALCLPTMPSDARLAIVEHLRQSLPGKPLLIASPDETEERVTEDSTVRMVPYPAPRSGSEWVLGAADYLSVSRLVEEQGLSGAVLLGPESATMDSGTVSGLYQEVAAGADLVVPRYETGPQQGLVNSALLYPLTRALFGVDTRFPLPLDAGLSRRTLSRLATVAPRVLSGNNDALVWPVAEAAIAGFSIRQVKCSRRQLPQPQETDLNTLFPAVCSSLFNDVEAKATYWQRARTLPPGRTPAMAGGTVQPADMEEISALAEGFRHAFSNLREIWSLVLPPQTLLSLKKLSLTSADHFVFPPSLWARVVYDFALAYHLRTLNRGHLLGAMTPLYLAWVGGFLRETGVSSQGEGLSLENTAKAFEQEKPYLVSRWRWPDRFNP